MAAAMARGWAVDDGGPEAMLFTDSGSGRASRLAEEVGGEAVASNADLAARSDLLVLAIKPGVLSAVAGETRGRAGAVMSLLGATSLESVAEAYPGASTFRLMPNVAVEVRRGVLCYAVADGVDPGLEAGVRSLLQSLGRVVDLEDSQFDPATAVMGCSPAYLALAVEAIADAGSIGGLEAGLSRSLVVDTAAGTAELLRRHEPEEVRRAVASPGGSTEAGLAALEEAGVREGFAAAVRASLERMRAG
jgi:pyrroline-5-carboxylate reductase